MSLEKLDFYSNGSRKKSSNKPKIRRDPDKPRRTKMDQARKPKNIKWIDYTDDEFYEDVED